MRCCSLILLCPEILWPERLVKFIEALRSIISSHTSHNLAEQTRMVEQGKLAATSDAPHRKQEVIGVPVVIVILLVLVFIAETVVILWLFTDVSPYCQTLPSNSRQNTAASEKVSNRNLKCQQRFHVCVFTSAMFRGHDLAASLFFGDSTISAAHVTKCMHVMF